MTTLIRIQTSSTFCCKTQLASPIYRYSLSLEVLLKSNANEGWPSLPLQLVRLEGLVVVEPVVTEASVLDHYLERIRKFQ